jgi:hypothetical protein
MYAGIAILFYLTIHLQEVASYTALERAHDPSVTLAVFAFSKRIGALTTAAGRASSGAGPLVAAGTLLLAQLDGDVRTSWTSCPPYSSSQSASAHGRSAHGCRPRTRTARRRDRVGVNAPSPGSRD